MSDSKSLTDVDLINTSGGKKNGMCEYEKLSPNSCQLCANCEYLMFTNEYNSDKSYGLCLCKDLNKEFWVNLSQFSYVVKKTN